MVVMMIIYHKHHYHKYDNDDCYGYNDCDCYDDDDNDDCGQGRQLYQTRPPPLPLLRQLQESERFAKHRNQLHQYHHHHHHNNHLFIIIIIRGLQNIAFINIITNKIGISWLKPLVKGGNHNLLGMICGEKEVKSVIRTYK